MIRAVSRVFNNKISLYLVFALCVQGVQPTWAGRNSAQIRQKKAQTREILTDLYTRLAAEKVKRGEEVSFDKDQEVQLFLASFGTHRISGKHLIQLDTALAFLQAFHQLVIPRSIKDPQESESRTPSKPSRPILDRPDSEATDRIISLFEEKWKQIEARRDVNPMDWEAAFTISYLLNIFATPMFCAWINEQCRDHDWGCIPESVFGMDLSVPNTHSGRVLSVGTGIWVMNYLTLGAVLHGVSSLRAHWVDKWAESRLLKLEGQIHAWVEEMSAELGIKHLGEMTRLLLDPRAIAAPAWNEDPDCPICLQEYQDSQEARVRDCGHKFCHSCFDAVKRRPRPSEQICPLCRVPLEAE